MHRFRLSNKKRFVSPRTQSSERRREAHSRQKITNNNTNANQILAPNQPDHPTSFLATKSPPFSIQTAVHLRHKSKNEAEKEVTKARNASENQLNGVPRERIAHAFELSKESESVKEI